MINEDALNENINRLLEVMELTNDDVLIEEKKKADRCLRIARRKYDKPSAYRSGAIVRCRNGKIWKDLKEDDINEAPEDIKELLYKAHESITKLKGNDHAPNINELEDWVQNHINKGMDEAKKTDYSKEKKDGLHGWFSRRGGGGNKGWVDCNTCKTVDGKKKCKACGREKGEKRAKYPSCRPTPASCGTPGKGKKWGKTKEESYDIMNEAEQMDCNDFFDFNSLNQHVEFDKPLYSMIAKRRTAKLVYVSPKQYIYKIAQGFGGLSYDDVVSSGAVIQSNIDKYAEAMKSGAKFPIGYYTKDGDQQEGRHRALAAMKLGCDKIPVIQFIKISDKEFSNIVNKLKGKSFDELDTLFKKIGFQNGITRLGYNDLQRYVEYNLNEELDEMSPEECIDTNKGIARDYNKKSKEDKKLNEAIEKIKQMSKLITEAEAKIKCTNCGWSWNVKDGGDDLYMCHKCGHDNSNELTQN